MRGGGAEEGERLLQPDEDEVEAEVQQLRRLLLPDIESVGVKNSNLHFVDKQI